MSMVNKAMFVVFISKGPAAQRPITNSKPTSLVEKKASPSPESWDPAL